MTAEQAFWTARISLSLYAQGFFEPQDRHCGRDSVLYKSHSFTMEHNLHRRKSSKEEDENIVLVARPMDTELEDQPAPLLSAPSAHRSRVHSSPVHARSVSMSIGQPPSAGPFRTGFNVARPPPSSPFRSSFGTPSSPMNSAHSRTRSISAFTPSVHSPLASSFPPPGAPLYSVSSPTLYAFPGPGGPPQPSSTGMNTSNSAPDAGSASNTLNPTQTPSIPSSRRNHARLHSRNLSVFFPRPGSLSTASIAEDGSQELEMPTEEAPVSTIPSASPSINIPSRNFARGNRLSGPPTPLGAGFTFGARPPSGLLASEYDQDSSSDSGGESLGSAGGRAMRRGHHHKHSLSHSFFSFLEPGSTQQSNEQLHTQPTPTPLSPWAPMSAIPSSDNGAFPPQTPVSENGHNHIPWMNRNVPQDSSEGNVLIGMAQFVLGAWLWVAGQSIGSLSVTGLGYWVVFDAFGVGLGDVLRRFVAPTSKGAWYGPSPSKTVLLFGQAVYLLFSSVYICKETVEHLLLSASPASTAGSGGDGHHHHHGDEDEGIVGIEFPVLLACITLLSVLATSVLYRNHGKLVGVTHTRLHTLYTLLSSAIALPPAIATALSNPFTLAPLVFASSILGIGLLVQPEHHRTADLLLAALTTIVTFKLAYTACVVLGSVLLQTAPARSVTSSGSGAGGASKAGSGKMEAFLRAMREVERHPQVLHLPAPHIWVLGMPGESAASLGPRVYNSEEELEGGAGEKLVVTLELHVRDDLGDDDVLALTRWAWERCVAALGWRGGMEATRQGDGPEVTVGVVRG
ncbi:hypothetical protein H0H92_013288 [Tricholoma furcatifolium]|nr:hypothetical protein H0H92_013288 [Tricholoma furcatifolium]